MGKVLQFRAQGITVEIDGDFYRDIPIEWEADIVTSSWGISDISPRLVTTELCYEKTSYEEETARKVESSAKLSIAGYNTSVEYDESFSSLGLHLKSVEIDTRAKSVSLRFGTNAA